MFPVRRTSRTTGKRTYEERKLSLDELDDDQPLKRTRIQECIDDLDFQLKPKATKSQSRRVSVKKGLQKRRGRLSGIIELPVDILYEIFSHLRPRDVLQLTRASKGLIRLLMNSDASTVWKAARRNIAIGHILVPECPSDMNEAQFAHLLFVNVCHHCQSPHTLHTILWNCRKRVCASCLRLHYTTQRPEDALVSKDGIQVLFDQVETRQSSKIIHEIAYPIEQDDIGTKMNAGLLRSCGEPNLLDEWLRKVQDDFWERVQHSKECSTWMAHWDSNRQSDRDRIRQEREDAILAQLDEAGWGEELEEQRNFHGLGFLTSSKCFKVARPLTARAWSKMKDNLFFVMDSGRTKRFTSQLNKMWTRRHKLFSDLVQDKIDQFSEGTIMPPVADFAQAPTFRDVLLHTPIEVEITTEMLQNAFSYMPKITQEWRQRVESELFKLANSVALGAIRQDDMDIATLTFECGLCSDRIRYPRILFHACTTSCHDFLYYKEHAVGTLEQFYRDIYQQPWNSKHIIMGPNEHEKRKDIVMACGLNPETTTTRTMDGIDPILRLVTRRTQSTVLVLRWRSAMHHVAQDPGSAFTWKLLTDEETVEVLKHEPVISEPTQITRSPSSKWISVICQHCDGQIAISGLQDHLMNLHGKSSIIKGDWYWGEDARSDYTLPPSFTVPSSFFSDRK